MASTLLSHLLLPSMLCMAKIYRPTFEYPFSYLYGLRSSCARVYVCGKTFFDISLSYGDDGRKMYTTQDKTHTTNGWKNIIFYLFVFVRLFFPAPREIWMALAVNTLRNVCMTGHNVKYHQYRMLSKGGKFYVLGGRRDIERGGLRSKFHLLCCPSISENLLMRVHTCESKIFFLCLLKKTFFLLWLLMSCVLL
jgi:hypothetical protein